MWAWLWRLHEGLADVAYVSEETRRHHLRHELSRGVDGPRWPTLDERIARAEDEGWTLRRRELANERRRQLRAVGGRGR